MVAKNNSVARVRGPRSAARRQHILATTRDLFVKRGFHQTGMAQIASSSGIAVGQIYRDFANKEAIIAAICEADLAEWLEEETLETAVAVRSEEHTSELQSLMRSSYDVLFLKKKNQKLTFYYSSYK